MLKEISPKPVVFVTWYQEDDRLGQVPYDILAD